MTQGPRLFRRGDYDNEALSWVRVSVKMFSVPWKLMIVKQDDKTIIVCFALKVPEKMPVPRKRCSGFEFW
jgi:hypothetical protein